MHIMMQRILLMPDIATIDIVKTTTAGLLDSILWLGTVLTFSSKPDCSLVIVLFV